MTAPIWMYFLDLALLIIVGIVLVGGVPFIERFANKEEKELGGSTRVTHKGSMRYVEIVPESRPDQHNLAM